MRTLFNYAFGKIAALPPTFASTGFPGSLFWTTVPFTDAELDISLSKLGKGLQVIFERHEMPGMAIKEFPSAYTLELPSGLRISFGAQNGASDYELMQYLANITAPRIGDEYGQPWLILLIAQPWRCSETGEIMLVPSLTYPQDVDPTATNPEIPRNAAQSRCFVIATRRKEIERLLRFGRDSNWPLSISLASTLDGTNSAVVTYPAEWTDCDSSEAWFHNQWYALAASDRLVGLPVMFRQNVTWMLSLSKEDNSLRAILREKSAEDELVQTPEDDGPPCYLLYGPRANNNNNNTFTWSGPSGVLGYTGQRPVGPDARLY
jgi:hypothetical protein